MAEEGGIIHADATQLQQVLMNLCTNAAHAMRETGGILEVRLDTVDVEANVEANLHPGPHVLMTIRDTGHGIEPEILERIFEPYFTTKGVGEGTGMGLAVAHGIIASHGGAITVHDGTTVRNCSFAGNVARSGGGGAVYADGSASSFENCVFWNNDPEPITFRNDSPLITYSLVEGGWPGEGNIDLDPRFVDLANGDLHLLPDSPAIDAGDPDFVPSPGETDIDGQKRVWNGRVDMGADEFGSFAFGDLNCDGRFDALDIEPFLGLLFP